ncbi:cell-wall protein, partial [Alloscardovia venturai]
MTLHKPFWQPLIKGGALLVAASTLFGGALAYADDIGGGSATSPDGGSGAYSAKIVWATNDNFGPANDATVTSVLTGQLAGKVDSTAQGNITQATTAARQECETNYANRHGGNATGANCRVFGVGAVRTNEDGSIARSNGGYREDQWLSAWVNEVKDKTYIHTGKETYDTSTRMSTGQTINDIAAREMRGGNHALVVIVLAADQPKLWDFTPDKSWVKYSNGKWATVIDAKHTNTTGADTQTILDGDKLGSVVNGSLGENLGDSLGEFKLVDDYTAADYLWDPDMNDVHVYAAPIPEASTTVSSVDDILT